MSRPVAFKIEKELKGALGRTGVISTPHGDIKTPAYVVVGTKATVKSLTPEDLRSIGVQSVLANTYHLYLQPGDEVIRDVGGLHSFMNWQGPTWTDSGGFQVFSLGEAFGKSVSKFGTEEEKQRRTPSVYSKELASSHGKLAIVDEEGVTFTSHHDGSMHRFTAERSIEIQHNIGADIIFAFDECTSPTADWEYQKEAMDRTHRWAERSLKAHRQNVEMNNRQGLFGIVQGGRFEDLRRSSAKYLADMDFDGYGVGGSFTKNDLDIALETVNKELPEEKPRHLLGIGSEPIDLFVGVEYGIDTFDCVAPTRVARTGQIYTKEGKVNITRSEFQHDHTLLSEWCPLFEGSTYTRSYLAHLFRAQEMLAARLASIINLHFMVSLVEDIRKSIKDETFSEFRDDFLMRYKK